MITKRQSIDILSHDKNKGRKHTYLSKLILNKYERELTLIISLFSATSHMASAAIYNCLPLLPFLYFPQPQEAVQQVLAHAFIPDESCVLYHPACIRLLYFPMDFNHRTR